MPDRQRPPSRAAFEIAVICALSFEFDAAEAMLDQDWEENGQLYGVATGDGNAYRMGRIGIFNVVLVHLPGMGKMNASTACASLRLSFQNIKLCLVVGICGGIPFRRPDIKTEKITEIVLGDVIISTAVVQHDFGRRRSNKLIRKNTLQDNLPRPPDALRSLLGVAKTKRSLRRLEQQVLEHFAGLLNQEDFEASTYPGTDKDILYEPTYRHKHQDTNASCICAKCDKHDDAVCSFASESTSTCVALGCDASKQIPRFRLLPENNPSKPRLHFGTVASGDSIMQSSYHRNVIVTDEEEEIIAFEMEGAGVWNDAYSTIVIKGVSDYSDSHKNYGWQEYAAATAACGMKALIQTRRPNDKPGQPVAEYNVWLDMALRLRDADLPVATPVHWSENLLIQVLKGAPDIPESGGTEMTRRDPEAHLQAATTGMQHEKSKECTRWLTFKQGTAKVMVDYAYSLLDQRGEKSTKEDFESMEQAFLRARSALLTTREPSLLQDTLWGLMLVEMDLSRCTSFEIFQKEQHLRDAEIYNDELLKCQHKSPNATTEAQIMIGRYIIKGIKASLQSKRQEGDKDKAKESLSDAEDGMERGLRELKMVDSVSYNKSWKTVSAWRKLLWDDVC